MREKEKDELLRKDSIASEKLADSWDEAYKSGMTMWYPSECIIRFVSKYMKKQTDIASFKEIRYADTGLDIGCGNGANVLYLRRLGYNAIGVDISRKAVEIGNSLLAVNGFPRCLVHSDIGSAEFGDASFDFIVSHAALDHILFSKYLDVIRKIRSILKPGGLFFMTLRGMDAFENEKKHATEIEGNTLLSKESSGSVRGFENPHEKNVPQHYFTQMEIEKSLRNFDILEIQKTVEFCGDNLKYSDSRWFVTSRLI